MSVDHRRFRGRLGFFAYQFPFILWAILIFISSSVPSADIPKFQFLKADKVIHFIIFFVFCALTHRAIKYQGRYRLLSVYNGAFSILITVMYGVIDETHQIFVPGRDASWKDLAADALGALLYIGLIWAWGRVRRSRSATGHETA